MEGVDFAEAHIGTHILPAEFVVVGQMPIVFEQQGFGFGVAVEHFHARVVDTRHIGYESGGAFAGCFVATGFITFVEVVNRVVQVAFRTALACEIVAFVAVAVGGKAV